MKKIVFFIVITIISVGLLIRVSQILIPVKEGWIYEKEYVEPSGVMILQPIINGEIQIYIPTWYKQPERYLIRIRNTVNGKERAAAVEVTEKEYSKYNVGDFYNCKLKGAEKE